MMMVAFYLISSAFSQGGAIPAQYTCDGADVSPPLSWGGGPAGTAAFALICEDPDAPVGNWVHWVVYNIPAGRDSLPEGLPAVGQLEDGTVQGVNGWGRTGYGGPCPPSGTHRYFFRLYALDSLLELPAGANASELREAMSGHVLDEAELMGVYSRQ